MTMLSNICEDLNDATALLERYERALAESPDMPSLLLNVKSLRKRRQRLEEQFLAAAKASGIDVCSYRLFAEDDETPKIGSLAGALSSFQSLVSTVYDAIANGPKQRAKVSAEIAQKTAFQFGYTFSGSVGFVLTIPNEQLLADMQTDLDAALDTIFSMAKSPSPEAIGEYAQQLGHASVRSLQSWVRQHTGSGLGADIRWMHDKQTKSALLMQQPELRHLRDAIDETSAETIEELTLVGELTAADLGTKTFKMKFEDGEDIRGKFVDAIGPAHHAELPQRYKAFLERRTRVHYSMQEDEVDYHLLRLELLG